MPAQDIYRPRYCCMTYGGQEHQPHCQALADACPDPTIHNRARAYGGTCDACGTRTR